MNFERAVVDLRLSIQNSAQGSCSLCHAWRPIQGDQVYVRLEAAPCRDCRPMGACLGIARTMCVVEAQRFLLPHSAVAFHFLLIAWLKHLQEIAGFLGSNWRHRGFYTFAKSSSMDCWSALRLACSVRCIRSSLESLPIPESLRYYFPLTGCSASFRPVSVTVSYCWPSFDLILLGGRFSLPGTEPRQDRALRSGLVNLKIHLSQ